MIEVTHWLSIDENEVQLDFIRSSGPGGQNVNKVSSAVQLRFDVRNSLSLPADVKERLTRLAGSRLTNEGVLLIEGQQYRTQEQNRADVLLRLVTLLRQAAQKPKPRRKTRPTAASQAERIDKKKRRSKVKQLRSFVNGADE
jgi:ribosome-associated protein